MAQKPRKTPAGNWRASYRDAAGRQRSKTFPTEREAKKFLSETETNLAKGAYVDPHAGRVKFGDYAVQWLESRSNEITTAARDLSIMRNHVLPAWEAFPLNKIDYLAAATWAAKLAMNLAPATVAKCIQLTANIVESAVRDRLVASNPFENVKPPARRRRDAEGETITQDKLVGDLLPQIPERYRALVAVAGGTGLRWGECIGLRWDAIDMENGTLDVLRVITEVSGHKFYKPYPKSRAGRRTVPLPPFALDALIEHRDRFEPSPTGEIFTNSAGSPPSRTLFRIRVWRPALVRAGLLGKIVPLGPKRVQAAWRDSTGREHLEEFPTHTEAVKRVAVKASGGLRFHDLRHSYATWLVSRNVPVNVVQRVLGHENASTTLNLYTHAAQDGHDQVRKAFAAFLLPQSNETGPETQKEPS